MRPRALGLLSLSLGLLLQPFFLQVGLLGRFAHTIDHCPHLFGKCQVVCALGYFADALDQFAGCVEQTGRPAPAA